MSVRIETYWIRHGLSCANVLSIIAPAEDAPSLLKKFGMKNSKSIWAPDSLLSNVGVKQCEILYHNQALQRIFLNANQICCSLLSRSIETAILVSRPHREGLIPIPFISEERKKLIKINKDYIPYEKKTETNHKTFLTLGYNKDNEPKIKNNKIFSILKQQFANDKLFWNTVVDESRRVSRTVGETRKLPDINWSIADDFIGDPIAAKPDKKKFFKTVIPMLIEKTDKLSYVHLKKFSFVFISHESFIKSLLKPLSQYRDIVEDIGHTNVVKLTYTYNIREKSETLIDVEKIYPTEKNHDGLILKDSNYYMKYHGDEIPLQMSDIDITHLSEDVVVRCPSSAEIGKKLRSKKKSMKKNKNPLFTWLE